MADFQPRSPPPLMEEELSASDPFSPRQPPLPQSAVSVTRQRFRSDKQTEIIPAAAPRQGVLRRSGARINTNPASLVTSRLRFEQTIVRDEISTKYNNNNNDENDEHAPMLPALSLLQRQAVLNAPVSSTDNIDYYPRGVQAHDNINNDDNNRNHDNNNGHNNNNNRNHDNNNGYNNNNNNMSNEASENSPLLEHNSPGAYYSGREDSGDGDGLYDDGVYDDDDPAYIKSVYLLSLSIVFIVSVVFVIIVSGLTTLVSKRNTPRFRISSDWKNGHHIPKKYGCNSPVPISIPLYWKNVPTSTTNLVVLFANADTDKVHWLVTDIPLTGKNIAVELPANASANRNFMPPQAHQQPNSHLENGLYYPPCHSNTFVIHAYAIDQQAKVIQSNSSRKIMNSFVGVPTARYSGSYGVPHRYSVVDDAHDEESGYGL